MAQILFVMWRETLEAMLVVGILSAWLARQPDAQTSRKFLWGGVLGGLVGAVLLAWVIFAIDALLPEDAHDYFQAALMLIAAGLILQMVFWMRRNGRSMKSGLESQMASQVEKRSHWGVALLAGIAVAREGSEAVIFLSGLASGQDGMASVTFWIALLMGFGLAAITFYLFQLGAKFGSWRVFFRVTEALLLLLGCALLVGGVERLIGVEALPALVNRVWDSRWLLDDGSVAGGMLAAFTGYRAQPSLMLALTIVAYWAGVRVLLWRAQQPRQR